MHQEIIHTKQGKRQINYKWKVTFQAGEISPVDSLLIASHVAHHLATKLFNSFDILCVFRLVEEASFIVCTLYHQLAILVTILHR